MHIIHSLYVACGCDPIGRESEHCNEKGKCDCKDNFGGLKCDGCYSGAYYGYPNCTGNWILKNIVNFESFSFIYSQIKYSSKSGPILKIKL